MKSLEKIHWANPLDGPWPEVHVGGDLENAENEWLVSNELGVYSMSTVALMHTRRQHGMLVSHLDDESERYVILSHLEMILESEGRQYKLSTHQFPNIAPTLGYQHLEYFAQDPLPRWVYRFPNGVLERTLCLSPTEKALVISLTWTGKKPVRIMLRPLMPLRPAGELTAEHGAMLQTVTMRKNEVAVQPLLNVPELCFSHQGVFMGSPDWWRKFEYLDDRGRYEDFQEDMWSPGVFELTLTPRKSEYFVAALGQLPKAEPEKIVMESAQKSLATDPGSLDYPALRSLVVASKKFIYGGGKGVFAGFPWLAQWSRDELLALPGLYLAQGDLTSARRSYRRLLAQTKDGLLPRRSGFFKGQWEPCLDASLLLADVGQKIIDAHQSALTQEPEIAAELAAFTKEVLHGITSVFYRVLRGEGDLVSLNNDGLVEIQSELPLTWMDSVINGQVCTPRHGASVEFQAFWVRTCEVLQQLAAAEGLNELAKEAQDSMRAATDSFERFFWCDDTEYPFDCLGFLQNELTTGSGRYSAISAAIRPNALIALALCPRLFNSAQADEILARVEEVLLTEKGLRTLEPQDPQYIGNAGGTIEERRAASHQGSVWPHLLLYYVRARLRRRPEDAAWLGELIGAPMIGGRCLGQVSQIADGDSPHRLRGSPLYAMATVMLLEAFVVDLKQKLPSS